MTAMQGLALLVALGVVSLAATLWTARRTTPDKGSFLVADRAIHWRPGAASVAATWIWATGMFIAAEQAYKHGWPGLFWFAVPNIITLVVFSIFAAKIRARMPDGFTLSGYMREHKSARVQRLYLVTLGGLAVFSTAVNLLVGGLIVHKVTGLAFPIVTLALAAVALSYSLRSGLKASILTDYLQMAVIAVVCLTLAPWAIATIGIDTWFAGFGGITGDYTALFSGPALAVFWSFGLSTSLGLLGGPFGDQTFWQRAFAIRPNHIKPAFIGGAALFAIVPITMGALGFAAAGAGLTVDDTQLTNLAAIEGILPWWTVIPFLLYVFSGLLSTIDSNMAAVSSIVGHDGTRDPANVVRNARWAIFAMTAAAIVIANTPVTVTQLFVFYGTFRLSTTAPTIMALYWPDTSERGMFWGITSALVVGVPMSAYGNLVSGNPWFIAGASVATLTLSLGITLAATQHERRRARSTPATVGASA